MLDCVTRLYDVYNAKTPEEVKEIITGFGYEYQDLSEEYGYMNLRIPFVDGYVRIYQRPDNTMNIQKWHKTEVKYSGIPTFEPSGRRSF